MSPLLLLPGMMCDRRLWAAQIEAFDEAGQPTLLGDITRSDSVAAIARDVLAGAPERFTLAGLSMGGIVAFELWRQAPERIAGLALLDTNPFAERPERAALREAEIRSAREGGLRELMIEAFKPLYLGRRARTDTALRELLLDMALALGPGVFARQSVALRERPDSTATLATITCPALVMCGREDAVCPVENHEYMASRIPQAALEIVDDCGHLPPMEAPHAVTRALTELLARARD